MNEQQLDPQSGPAVPHPVDGENGTGLTPDLPTGLPGHDGSAPEIDMGERAVPDEDVNPDAALPEPPD